MLNYVKIAAFTFQYEYAVLRHLLEQEEIRFFFQNETAMGIMPFHHNALGGIYLKVHPEDVKKAEDILDNFKNQRDDFLHIV